MDGCLGVVPSYACVRAAFALSERAPILSACPHAVCAHSHPMLVFALPVFALPVFALAVFALPPFALPACRTLTHPPSARTRACAGEHIDYSGYSVLPMAVEKDIVVAVGRRSDGVIHIANIHADRYADRVLHVDRMPTVDPAQHDWTNYVLAAYQVRLPPSPPAPDMAVGAVSQPAAT